MIKKFTIFSAIALICLLVLVSGVLHYYKIGSIPFGFHVDELSSSVTIGCLATEGTDAHRIHYPLFSDMHYGSPKPPTYIYPGLLWAKVFGYSVASLRIYCVTVHLLGVVGLLFLARLFFGWRYALLTVLVASLSPWAWVISRVAFESFFSTTFLIWGLYFFFKSAGGWRMAIAGIFFAAAMYAYPPTRLHVPLMAMTLMLYARHQGRLSFKSAGIFIASLAVSILPLVLKILSGEVQGRFNEISILSKEYLLSQGKAGSIKDLFDIFVNNYLMHLKPEFLFTRGDPSLIHSTGHHGILSWLDMLGLVIAIAFLILVFFKKCMPNPLLKEKAFLLFCVVNIFIGIAPVGLTNSELPNSLRIVGAWPFMCLLTGFFLWQACQRVWLMWVAILLTAVFFSVSLFKVYFYIYPKESKGMFNVWTLNEANALKTDEDWLRFIARYRNDDYHARYFLMQYRKVGCSESKTIWDNVRSIVKQYDPR